MDEWVHCYGGIMFRDRQSQYSGLMTSKKQKESFLVLLSRAQIAYDAGKYDDALEFAEKSAGNRSRL